MCEVTFWLGTFLLAYVEDHDLLLLSDESRVFYLMQNCGGDVSLYQGHTLIGPAVRVGGEPEAII